jgi:hypothetical protein
MQSLLGATSNLTASEPEQRYDRTQVGTGIRLSVLEYNSRPDRTGGTPGSTQGTQFSLRGRYSSKIKPGIVPSEKDCCSTNPGLNPGPGLSPMAI